MEKELDREKQRNLLEKLLLLRNDLISRIKLISNSKSIKPWGKLNKRHLMLEDLLILDELYSNMNEERMDYLVNSYNNRDLSLDPVEAHFVVKNATNYGYEMVLVNDRTIFKKRQKTFSNK